MKVLGLLPYPLMAMANLVLGPPVFLLSLLGLRPLAYRPVELWCLLLHLVTGVSYRVDGLELVPHDGPYVVITELPRRDPDFDG